MKKLFIGLVLIFLTTSIFADTPQFSWNKKNENEWILADTITQSAFILLMLIDWKQTDSVIEKKETITQKIPIVDQNGTIIGCRTYTFERYMFEEQNPILGKHPSRKKVAIYNISVILGHTLISYMLPNPWRKIWQGSGIGIEIYATSTNYATGVKLEF